MKIKALIIAGMLLGALCLASPCLASTVYTVYCANGKIEVDTRNEAQMKSARGSNVKVLSKFNFKLDADNFAKKLGGIGAQCK
jgi:hypothetical protein